MKKKTRDAKITQIYDYTNQIQLKVIALQFIINVLSSVCKFSNEGIGAYTASKAGYLILMQIKITNP